MIDMTTPPVALDRMRADALELLGHLHQQAEALAEVISRQEAVVQRLQEAVATSRETQAGYATLGGMQALEGAVRLQEGTVTVAQPDPLDQVVPAPATSAPADPAPEPVDQPEAPCGDLPPAVETGPDGDPPPAAVTQEEEVTDGSSA